MSAFTKFEQTPRQVCAALVAASAVSEGRPASNCRWMVTSRCGCFRRRNLRPGMRLTPSFRRRLLPHLG
jgi:hypothetical protein